MGHARQHYGVEPSSSSGHLAPGRRPGRLHRRCCCDEAVGAEPAMEWRFGNFTISPPPRHTSPSALTRSIPTHQRRRIRRPLLHLLRSRWPSRQLWRLPSIHQTCRQGLCRRSSGPGTVPFIEKTAQHDPTGAVADQRSLARGGSCGQIMATGWPPSRILANRRANTVEQPRALTTSHQPHAAVAQLTQALWPLARRPQR